MIPSSVSVNSLTIPAPSTASLPVFPGRPVEYGGVQRKDPLPEPKIRTCGIDHIVLHVADYERSRKFYIELLGFTPFFECEKHGFFRTGDCQIGLFEATGGHAVVGYAEVDHICLRSAATGGELLGALQAYGVQRIPRPEGLGWQVTKLEGVYFRDPDGHVLQLLPAGQWPQVEVELAHRGG